MYIAEAHPKDEWQTDSNIQEGVILNQHTSFLERIAAAELCSEKLALTLPVLVDGMDDAAATQFAAWPERIYVADRQGKISYMGGPGPFGFDPISAETALKTLL